ncbi:MAG: hypothetical protein M1823_008990, partial [Watsoniomyces obsoletus]
MSGGGSNQDRRTERGCRSKEEERQRWLKRKPVLQVQWWMSRSSKESRESWTLEQDDDLLEIQPQQHIDDSIYCCRQLRKLADALRRAQFKHAQEPFLPRVKMSAN